LFQYAAIVVLISFHFLFISIYWLWCFMFTNAHTHKHTYRYSVLFKRLIFLSYCTCTYFRLGLKGMELIMAVLFTGRMPFFYPSVKALN